MERNRWKVYQRFFFFYINYLYTQNWASTFLIPCRHARGRVYKRRCSYICVCVRRTSVCRACFYLLSLVLTSLTSVVHILLFPLEHTVNYISVISQDTGDDKNQGSIAKSEEHTKTRVRDISIQNIEKDIPNERISWPKFRLALLFILFFAETSIFMKIKT